MKRLLKILLMLKIFELSAAQLEYNLEVEPEDELSQCLSEFDIKDLLRFKHSLEHIEPKKDFDAGVWSKDGINQTETVEEVPSTVEPVCKSQNCLKPLAMALTGQPRGYHVNAAYHHHHHHQPHQHQPWITEEKPTKLQTLFQISITALAFLSFGGYLLCLIVQAIKSKGTTYFHPVVTSTAATTNGAVKRIKVYRRGRRAAKQAGSNAPKHGLHQHQLHFNYPYDIWLP